MDLVVERLNEADTAAWLALATAVEDLFGAAMGHDPAFLDWVTRSIARGAAYGVRIGDEVAGVMHYRNGRINWLAVGQRFRRCGVGRALVAYALTSGEPVVRVTTFGEGHPHPEASAARALYQALGFSPAQESAEIAPDGTPRIVLVWYHSELQQHAATSTNTAHSVNRKNPMATQTAATWHLGELHHVGLTVADIERSIHFYRDLLGLTLVRRRPQVDNDYVGLQTGYPGVVLSVASFKVTPESQQSLEVVQYLNHAGPPAETATNRAGNTHLCLTVTDLRACYAALQAQGVRFKSEPVTITAGPNQGGLVVYFFDPDGYTLELFQPPQA